MYILNLLVYCCCKNRVDELLGEIYVTIIELKILTIFAAILGAILSFGRFELVDLYITNLQINITNQGETPHQSKVENRTLSHSKNLLM